MTDLFLKLMQGTVHDYIIACLILSNVLSWGKLSVLSGRYHRQDALQFGTAKAIQAAFPHIKLVNESANGDGDYSLDRSLS